jgi:CHAT domain-containing protein/tetratricopeptide (TPR) repeat protein
MMRVCCPFLFTPLPSAFSPAKVFVLASVVFLWVGVPASAQTPSQTPQAQGQAKPATAASPASPELQEAERLMRQAGALAGERKFNDAINLAERALGIRDRVQGPEHPDVAALLTNLAQLYFAKPDYDRAESLFRRALSIRERALGAQHADVATSAFNLAFVLYSKGDYDGAELLYRRALTIREKALGPEHPLVAGALSSLAEVYRQKGEYVRAEPLLSRALLIREKALGPEHREVAITLNNFGGLYQTKGDYARAEPLFQRVLKIREKLFGPEHPEVAAALNNLAQLYKQQGDYARAEPLQRRALAVDEKALGPDHPFVSMLNNNLAVILQEQGRGDQAEPLYQRALAVREKALGPEHPDTAATVNNLAVLYLLKRDYARAEPLYRRALSAREKVFGPQNPNVASTLVSFAIMYETRGEVARAVELQARAADIRERNLSLVLATGSEEQKRLFMATLSDETDLALSLHNRTAPDDLPAARLALTTALRRKGRVLDAMSDQVGALRRRLKQQDRGLFDRLSAARAQRARLVLQGPGRTPPEQYLTAVVKLEAQEREIESAVSARSAEFRAQAQPVTIEGVQAAIPAGAALVEFVTYRPYNLEALKRSETFGARRYAAYVLRRTGRPSWAELGEAAAIEAAALRLRSSLANPESTDVKASARDLDRKVMEPMRRLLGPTTQVFLSPDGSLNLVPFGALVDERGRYLIERYSFTYLTSGRDLLRLRVKTREREPAMIVADPAFDRGSDFAGGQGSADGEGGRGRRSLGLDRAVTEVAPLPGTGAEAKSLIRLLHGASLLTKEKATEAAVKRARGPRVLHVATHGFFLADQRQDTADTRGLKVASGAPQPPPDERDENPLLRSGLILAGVKQQQSGPGEDGILTALEASALDLWGTKLVVLSACDTGVGNVQNGEGVYGLRRALVLAGAESQLMSLWQVDDEATRDLMVAYYRRLRAGEGGGDALRAVQLGMAGGLQAAGGRRRRGLGAAKAVGRDRRHPFFWAAFIQSGTWGGIRKL